MVRPRSAGSEVEEPSEEALMEQELARLQRSFRVMQNDYRAYREDAKRKMQKQKMLINALEKERIELDTQLAKMTTTHNKEKEANNTQTLEALARNEQDIINEIKAEMEKIKDVSQQVHEVEEKINRQRKKVGGINTGTDKVMAMNKRGNVLENRLDQAIVLFNKQLSTNRQLRDDIDHLRRERAMFDNLYRKLTQQLEKFREETREVIDTTNQAFEQRDEATNKMMALRERSEKDLQQHNTEMADLLRVIDHDEKVKEFMGIKNNERSELKAEETAKRNLHGADNSLNQEKETIRMYTEAFNRITEVTGESDIDVIVDAFIKREKENFALFNYVNEINHDVEKLQEDIAAIKQEMGQYKNQDVEIDLGRSSLIAGLEEELKQVSAEADKSEANLKRVNKVLDELKTDIEKMFKMLSCDPRPIKELLGGDAGVTNKTLMIYMGQMEQRAVQLTNLLHYTQMKKNEMLGLPPDLHLRSAPQTPALTKDFHTRVVAPSSFDDRDLDPSEEDEGEEPLTEEQLRSRVTRAIQQHALLQNRSHAGGAKDEGGVAGNITGCGKYGSSGGEGKRKQNTVGGRSK